MRLRSIIIGIVVLLLCGATTKYVAPGAPVTCVVKNKQQKCYVTPLLKELLKKAGLKSDGSLDNVIEVTQGAWLRPSGEERWNSPEKKYSNETIMRNIFKKLGLVNAVYAPKKIYQAAFIHGATMGSMKKRIDWLVHEYKQGIRFKKVIFIVGDRVLDEKAENPQVTPELRLKTEDEAAKWLYEHTNLPVTLKKIPVEYVVAKSKIVNGKVKRANTKDTIVAWLAQNPNPKGDFLAFSNQPFVLYQDLVLKTVLPKTVKLYTVGSKADSDVKMSVYLDGLARVLYQYKQMLMMKK